MVPSLPRQPGKVQLVFCRPDLEGNILEIVECSLFFTAFFCRLSPYRNDCRMAIVSPFAGYKMAIWVISFCGATYGSTIVSSFCACDKRSFAKIILAQAGAKNLSSQFRR